MVYINSVLSHELLRSRRSFGATITAQTRQRDSLVTFGILSGNDGRQLGLTGVHNHYCDILSNRLNIASNYYIEEAGVIVNRDIELLIIHDPLVVNRLNR